MSTQSIHMTYYIITMSTTTGGKGCGRGGWRDIAIEFEVIIKKEIGSPFLIIIGICIVMSCAWIEGEFSLWPCVRRGSKITVPCNISDV